MQKTTSKTKPSPSRSSGTSPLKSNNLRTNGSNPGNNNSRTGPSSKSNGSASKSQVSGELEEFFLDALKDIYWAEKHLVKALNKLQKSATTPELKDAFEDHRAVTEEQVTRLEDVFEKLGKKAQGKKCEAMEGLTKEADSIIEETKAGTLTRDVALIMAAQKVEHYEIATYGGLAQLAETLGWTEISDLLGQTLAEEKETDELLTSIAETHINMDAMNEDGEEDEEE